MESSSRRRRRPQKKDGVRDRLSEMPDDVLVHILSFLPTVDAVRTVLLRRFGNLWTLVPNLSFDINEAAFNLSPPFRPPQELAKAIAQYNIFVDNVLRLHKQHPIDKFRLYAYHDTADDIKTWLAFALCRQAKEIVFFVSTEDFYPTKSVLPNFTSQSLVTLELNYCRIDPKHRVDLGSLKKLVLEHVGMCELAFQQFITGCPSLQEVRIHDPYDMRTLSINAPNIHKLFLGTIGTGYHYNNSMLLDLPNIRSLELYTYRLPVIVDVSSVRAVYIHGSLKHDDEDDENTFLNINTALSKLHRAEVFQLSSGAPESFLDAIEDLHLSQITWKRVTLNFDMLYDHYLVGIYQLARRLKHLEELTIHARVFSTEEYWSRSHGDTTSLLFLELASSWVMPKLRMVTLHGYVNPRDCQLQLELFLKSAPVLDKLIIIPSVYEEFTAAEKLEFVKCASNLYRSSPNASVVFA